MKSRLLASPKRGFTLIEILTVITIIALLAALGFGGYQMALSKSATKDTLARLNALQLGVEGYKLDNGEYPEPLSSEASTEIGTATWSTGGAQMLYQVVTGDGNNTIKGGGIPSTAIPGSSGKIYWEEVTVPTAKDVENKKKKRLVDVGPDGSYFMIDGWRKPFQYVKALKDRNKRISNEDLVHSDADYEIWSYGKLDAPNDDPESQKEWIASWGAN